MSSRQARKQVAPPGVTAVTPPLVPLVAQNKTVETILTKKDPGDLSKQVVEVAALLANGCSVHLWKTIDGKSTIWQESGKLPKAEKITIEKEFSAQNPPRNVSQWARPLKMNGEVLGVLEVSSITSLSEKVRDSLEKFARIAETALNHAGQQRAVQEISAILEATKLLNSTLDLSELLKIVLQLATRLSGADRGTVFLLDRKLNEIWSLVGIGLDEHEIRISVESGIAGWVAFHGHPVRLEDAYADPRFDPTVDCVLGYRTHSLLALPIRNKSEDIVGVLELLNKAEGSFSAADQEFLSCLSDHVALALDNAQLHRELLAKQRMESDLILAHSVQRGLLPKHPPDLEGFDISVAYTPSQMVGGDYYDFMSLSPQKMLTVIADAEGKGVASALMMASVRATLHTLADHERVLEKIVKSMSRIMLGDAQTTKLLSIFFGVLDHRRLGFHYINAGHVPPIVIRQNGVVLELTEGGMVMGVLANATYKRGYVQFEKGDILVGYTDGITEAMDINGNQYAREQLVNTVRREGKASSKHIVETVLADVDRFSQGGPHNDDRVILILKVL
jgi:sigma-B regulation protein RsbU (phosphoserine phosphatase)